MTVEVLGEESRRHASAYVETPDLKNTLSVGANILALPREYHQVNPMTTLLLQEAAQKIAEKSLKSSQMNQRAVSKTSYPTQSVDLSRELQFRWKR